MRRMLFGLAMVAALAGCDMSKFQTMKWGQQPETRPAPTQKQGDDLKAEISTLKTENASLNERIQELQAREKSLSAKAERAEFLQQQQAEQLKALAAAPGERDKALEKAENLARQVEFLKARNADLERTVHVLAAPNQKDSTATSAPATTSAPAAPAVVPATQPAK